MRCRRWLSPTRRCALGLFQAAGTHWEFLTMRWFRLYDTVVDDPKVQHLSPEMFKHWINILCVSSQNSGKLPALDAVAFKLRVTEKRAEKILNELLGKGLIDKTDGAFSPHNWAQLQFQSDCSTERVKRFRQRSKAVSETASETPPESESESESEITLRDAAASEHGESDAASTATAQLDQAEPPHVAEPEVNDDYEMKLWRTGRAILAELANISDRKARSMIGKWLRDTRDNHRQVYELIVLARKKHIEDPIAWITAAIKANEKGGGKRDPMMAGLNAAYDEMFGADDNAVAVVLQ
jgi:hypothetical protein